jgi:phage-related protein
MKKINVTFYKTSAGNEPVREWLLSLSEADRKSIGLDIKTVEFGWPIGMPVCRKLATDLWEVRTDLSSNRIARTIFTIVGFKMYLLHGFIKKTQKTPKSGLELADQRKREVICHEKE